MNDVAVKKEEVVTIMPVCSICGDESSVVLRVEMPGVNKDDIEVRIENDQLVISGKLPDETYKGSWILRERRRGNYERRFTIDNTIDQDRIDAVYESGIMTLTLHIKDEVKPRRIEISAK